MEGRRERRALLEQQRLKRQLEIGEAMQQGGRRERAAADGKAQAKDDAQGQGEGKSTEPQTATEDMPAAWGQLQDQLGQSIAQHRQAGADTQPARPNADGDGEENGDAAGMYL